MAMPTKPDAAPCIKHVEKARDTARAIPICGFWLRYRKFSTMENPMPEANP